MVGVQGPGNTAQKEQWFLPSKVLQFSLEMGKYTNGIQRAKCCAELHTGVLGAEAKGREIREGFPEGVSQTKNVEERAGASKSNTAKSTFNSHAL